MKFLIALSAVLAVAVARPGNLLSGLSGLTYAAAPVAVAAPVAIAAPVAVSAQISSQYHSQDELGQYSYGYSNGLSAKTEVKAADGSTVGGYTYVDADGKLQSVEYSADSINGFRVAATNLPVAPAVPIVPALPQPLPVQDTIEVAEAKAKHLAALEEAKVRAAAVETPILAAEPIVAAAPIVATAKIVDATPLVSATPAISSTIITGPASLSVKSGASPLVATAPIVSAPIVSAPLLKSVPLTTPILTQGLTQGLTLGAASHQILATPSIHGYSYGVGVGPSVLGLNSLYSVNSGLIHNAGLIQPAISTYAAAPWAGAISGSIATGPIAPVDTAEVAQARAEHLAAVQEVKARNW